MPIKRKDLLGLRGADAGLIAEILSTAADMKRIMHAPERKSNLLSGKIGRASCRERV